jgi:YegS/Rv2252/BmrU family lipid kinase
MTQTHGGPDAQPQTRRGVELERAAQNAVLIVNTKARRGQEWFQIAQDCLRANGISLTAAHALHRPSTLPNVLRDAIAQGAKLVIVGGGDGSLRTAANILAHQEAVLGVLPLGTVNDFARNLGIAPEVETACQVIAEGCVARVDLGQANESYFVITASLGFSARTQRMLSPQRKKRLGPFGYVAAAVLALHRLRNIPITIRSQETNESLCILQAGVVNGHSWMGGVINVPGVDLESGGLAFYAVPPQNKLAFIRLVYNLRQGRFFHTPGLRAFTTCEVTVETERPYPLVLDGDLCGQTPVCLRVAPEALKVCVPADFN